MIDDYGIIGSRVDGVCETDIWKNHKTASSIKNDLGEDKFNTYLKFCVVRNPYDVMVSSYHMNKKHGMSFNNYAKITTVNNFNTYSINGESVCDYYIRYEHLEKDIIKLCKRLKITDYDIKNLPTHKSNIRKEKIHYREYYDEETRKIVYNNHKQEFDLFGYTF
jgi:hypothetical protein